MSCQHMVSIYSIHQYNLKYLTPSFYTNTIFSKIKIHKKLIKYLIDKVEVDNTSITWWPEYVEKTSLLRNVLLMFLCKYISIVSVI